MNQPASINQPTDSVDEEFVQYQPYHFTQRQLARLLILRGRVQESNPEETV